MVYGIYMYPNTLWFIHRQHRMIDNVIIYPLYRMLKNETAVRSPYVRMDEAEDTACSENLALCADQD
jgi:hypothetical protein